MKRKYKIIISVLVVLVLLVVGGLGFAGNYLYDLAISNTSDKSAVFSNPETSAGMGMETNETFFNEHAREDVFITSDDGLKLAGYKFMQENSHNWVITVHGYTGRASTMSARIEQFYNRGYNVLAPDLRGQGNSEGDYIGMGYDDGFDIVSWIEDIIKTDPEAKITLYGISMGAATIMNTTGQTLPDNVVLAIEDCGYTEIWDLFAYQLDSLFSLPAHPFLDAADLVTRIRAGYSFNSPGPIDNVAKSKIPTLFIHGDADKFVPFYMHDELYNAASCPKEKLVVVGAGHGQSMDTDYNLYWSTIDRFISTYNK